MSLWTAIRITIPINELKLSESTHELDKLFISEETILTNFYSLHRFLNGQIEFLIEIRLYSTFFTQSTVI